MVKKHIKLAFLSHQQPFLCVAQVNKHGTGGRRAFVVSNEAPACQKATWRSGKMKTTRAPHPFSWHTVAIVSEAHKT